VKVLIYSSKPFEIPLLNKANSKGHEIVFTPKRLTSETAMMAINFDAISIFSADDASPNVLEKLRDFGVKYITLRSAGYDNVNLKIARKLGFRVANAPDYSPNAIAEHAITLLMALNRNIPRAQYQTLQHNFLLDNLIGFDLHKKTVGVLGTGRIGSVLVKILHGFGCRILGNDTSINESLIEEFAVDYISKDAMCEEADIIFVCLPLTEITHHLLDDSFFEKVKRTPILVNIARGAIADTKAVLNALDRGLISGYATDVYEKEHGVFFYNRSAEKLKDAMLHRLIVHPKVLITPHQAFATREALQNIANTTLQNLNSWAIGKHAPNEL